MKKPVLLFYKSASVCKLTTVLADISMQNSFSSFGPKVPLAGDTTMEQEAAWLPMGCQTERTFSSCWFFHTVSSQKTKLFSGLRHFQAATPTVCKDWLYNSPWVIRPSCLHWLQVTLGAVTVIPLTVSSLSRVKPIYLISEQMYPTSLHCRGGGETVLVLAPSHSDQHGMCPGLPLIGSHINITDQEKCSTYSF